LGRPTTWPVRSKNLPTLDFFNMKYVTNTIHAQTTHGIHHLRETIYGAATAATITLDTLIILGSKNKHCWDVCKVTYAAHTEIY
jgi:hypothetical protein